MKTAVRKRVTTAQEGNMFIAITPAGEAETPQPAALANAAGFRWAMLLRPIAKETGEPVAVSMWLTPEQAAQAMPEGSIRGFDVVTARGAMTPASHVALVDWRLEAADEARFTSRWNAVYHAIEDRIGSRLLRDLDTPGRYAGLHAVTEAAQLEAGVIGAAVTEGESLAVTPAAVQHYEVVSLLEA